MKLFKLLIVFAVSMNLMSLQAMADDIDGEEEVEMSAGGDDIKPAQPAPVKKEIHKAKPKAHKKYAKRKKVRKAKKKKPNKG